MPKPPPPSLPKAALPRNTAFDPWNSSSTGHQRPEQQPGTAWRASRTGKLNSQFQSGPAGGPRTQDTGGPGARGRASVADMLKTPGLMSQSLGAARRPSEKDDAAAVTGAAPRGIFAGCVVYVNGSTYPLVSDHRLKHVLCENGAQMSLHLGRRRVTHVILGTPAGGAVKGAGGGLAGGKMEREMRRVGGVGVRFVGVEW
ncbi:BRCA1 C Terminus (BRCT) domain containing protein [Metarhizium acridum CQMa 102]|uniref:BRCA1 C Terminus (BRCT) domain containing protein n=1 Tax=Metarhizium acridum (strain CQMa 102) TaxID=655827 RepID=E9E1X3_METAQ|nr:BRCA1 C Terminus (BRCT) domain containing protein [Metarhizium acridum CQMa 102]EFY90070.1 BRCA1 C Terminus (BRCT) domain containing protein [Metarhizium acridum CQMa 102]